MYKALRVASHVDYRLVFQKNWYAKLTQYLCQLSTDFHNPFTDTLGGKSAIKLSLQISPHLKRVATLPCETRMQ